MKKFRALFAVLLLAGFGLAQNAPSGNQGLILQFQNSGTQVLTRAGGFLPINCSTGITCSYTGGVVVITSSGGGAPAFPVTDSGYGF
jgi:hypothetical protein